MNWYALCTEYLTNFRKLERHAAAASYLSSCQKAFRYAFMHEKGLLYENKISKMTLCIQSLRIQNVQ